MRSSPNKVVLIVSEIVRPLIICIVDAHDSEWLQSGSPTKSIPLDWRLKNIGAHLALNRLVLLLFGVTIAARVKCLRNKLIFVDFLLRLLRSKNQAHHLSYNRYNR